MKKNQEQREEKFAMIQRWKESGLTQQKFCQQETISFNNFYYWLKKFRKQVEKSPAKFIKLKRPQNLNSNKPGNVSTDSVFSEIIFANGNRLRFFNAIEIAQLKTLAS